MKDEEVTALIRGVYASFKTQKFILRKILSIRNVNDIKFFIKAGKRLVGHLADFGRK